jgi:hypothetical protein
MRPRKKLRRKVSAQIAKARTLGRKARFFVEHLKGQHNTNGFWLLFSASR